MSRLSLTHYLATLFLFVFVKSLPQVTQAGEEEEAINVSFKEILSEYSPEDDNASSDGHQVDRRSSDEEAKQSDGLHEIDEGSEGLPMEMR